MAYTVYDAVVEVLDELNYLNLAFENDLISEAALARFINPRVAARLGDKTALGDNATLLPTPPTLSTVTVAVRGYLKTKPFNKTPSAELVKLLSSSKVFLQTGLAEVHAVQTPENYDKITMLAKNTRWSADDPFYVIPQANSISVVASAETMQEIMAAIPKNDVLHANEERALITIAYDPSKAFECAGSFHFYTSQFANLGVSIILAFSSYDRISFLVKEADSSRAFKKITASIKGISKIHV